MLPVRVLACVGEVTCPTIPCLRVSVKGMGLPSIRGIDLLPGESSPSLSKWEQRTGDKGKNRKVRAETKVATAAACEQISNYNEWHNDFIAC